MNDDALGTYLNDHLAGSVGAIELLERLAEHSKDDPPRQQALVALRQAIEADQALLKDLLEQHSTGESTVKKAGAWLMEKLTRAKLHVAESKDSSLGELEALEVLSLGIEGKKCLWKGLAQVLPGQRDWQELHIKAEGQRQQVETWRLEAARKAFLG